MSEQPRDDEDDSMKNSTPTTTSPEKKNDSSLESKYSAQNRLPALLYTIGYLTFSTITVVSNKHLIKDAGFGNPIFVSSCGTIFAFVLSTILVHGKFVSVSEPKMTFKEWFKVCVPVGFFSSITLACANIVYVLIVIVRTNIESARSRRHVYNARVRRDG